MLGMGIGHPEATSDYRRPLTTMRAFLDGLDASPTPPPAEERCLAALGPKMLDLAGGRTAGTHPYFTTVDHTRFARERLGSGKLVAPEVACVVETDPVRAKAVARDYAKLYLGLRNYTRNLLEFGFTERDLADGGSTGSSTRSSPRAAPSRSPRSCAATSTPVPITSACSRWARRAFRASRGPRSRTP
jgi:probable F420-dependent oxidoreductase